LASHHAMSSSRAKPESTRRTTCTRGQRARIWATMRSTSSTAPVGRCGAARTPTAPAFLIRSNRLLFSLLAVLLISALGRREILDLACRCRAGQSAPTATATKANPVSSLGNWSKEGADAPDRPDRHLDGRWP
jgi:hypothetical protein